MRKRLRKKKRVREFQIIGMEIEIRLSAGTDFESFLNDFLENAVEACELQFGGGGKDQELSGYLELGSRANFRTNLDTVKSWLDQHLGIEEFRLGELQDAWYPNRNVNGLSLSHGAAW